MKKSSFIKSVLAAKDGNKSNCCLNHTGWYFGLMIFKQQFCWGHFFSALKGY